MIIKVFGLKAEQLARLQNVLESDAVRSENQYWYHRNDSLCYWSIEFAELLKTRYQKDTKTHSAEIGINELVNAWAEMGPDDAPRDQRSIFAPRRVLDAIFQALNSEFFPAKEG